MPSAASKESPAGVANGGYWGIPVKPQTTYRVSFYAKAANGFTGPLTVSLESADGKTNFASAKISGLSGEWKRFQTKLTTTRVAAVEGQRVQDHHNRAGHDLAAAGFIVSADLSQPPERQPPDIMELLAGMQPKFLRLPGGNYVEGNSFNQHFNWKETIGPVEQRPGHAQLLGLLVHRRPRFAGIR